METRNPMTTIMNIIYLKHSPGDGKHILTEMPARAKFRIFCLPMIECLGMDGVLNENTIADIDRRYITEFQNCRKNFHNVTAAICDVILLSYKYNTSSLVNGSFIIWARGPAVWRINI